MAERTKLSRRNFWVIAINSTSTFVLSYFLVFFTNHFIKIMMTAVFKYPISFTYDTIFFLIRGYEWTHDSVRLIYSAGPVLVLVLGIISLMVYYSFSAESGWFKIIFIWFSLHAFNFVFSGLSIGNIFTYGVGHVFNWMYLHDTAKMLVALVGFFGLLISAFVLTRPLVLSGNSYFIGLDERNKPFFIMSQIVVPFIIGSAINVLFFLPTIPVQEEYSWVVLAVLLLIISVRINKIEPLDYGETDEVSVRLSWPVLLFTILFLLSLRFGFAERISISW
ncbi:MAG: hypothetical protein L3J66_08460 [Bacteroidales bacterium]|nr:hypothetical protein [Bacteroidales bacterium]